MYLLENPADYSVITRRATNNIHQESRTAVSYSPMYLPTFWIKVILASVTTDTMLDDHTHDDHSRMIVPKKIATTEISIHYNITYGLPRCGKSKTAQEPYSAQQTLSAKT